MSNKEWFEEIPPQGVLCKEKSSGNIVKIIDKSHKHDGFVIDDCLTPNIYDPIELTNIASQERGKFAPWQLIETSPKTGKKVLLCNETRVTIGHFYDSLWRRGDNSTFHNPKKWLTLPE